MPRKFKKSARHPYVLKTIHGRPPSRAVVPREEYLRMQNLLFTLQELSQTLVSELKEEDILNEIMKTLGKALNAAWVNIWELTPDGNAVQIKQGYGKPGTEKYIEHSRKVPLKLGTAFIGRAMKTKKTWATSDMWTDPHLPRSWVARVKEQGFRGIVCAPQIVESAKVIGGMCVYFDHIRALTDFEMRLVTIAANQAAVSIVNAGIYKELTAERDKTLGMIHGLNVGIILYDNDSRILLLNPKAEEFLFINKKEVIGQIISAESAKHNMMTEDLYRISTMPLAEYEKKEYKVTGPSQLVVEITLIPVEDANHRKIGSMRILRDITPEKALEIMKSGFIATASHQMRTPLSGIRWALDMLLKGDEGPLTPPQTSLLRRTFDAASNLLAMLNDLLHMSELEEGKLPYHLKVLNVLPVVRNVCEEMESQAEKRNVKLEIEDTPTSLPPVEIDTKIFSMALQNLIDNAIRYSLPGKHVTIRADAGPKNVVLSIKDEGIGVSEEDKKFLFSKFFRGRNAIHLQTEGSGLGLYIAKHVVERHNGKISFESQENKGSVVTIYLPIAKTKKALPE